jgi:hypothetical protein
VAGFRTLSTQAQGRRHEVPLHSAWKRRVADAGLARKESTSPNFVAAEWLEESDGDTKSVWGAILLKSGKLVKCLFSRVWRRRELANIEKVNKVPKRDGGRRAMAYKQTKRRLELP